MNKKIFLPKTKLGKYSIILILGFFLFLILFFILIESGQKGGETFFSNLYLTIPFLIAVISGIASFFTGIISIMKFRERNIFVFISTLVGLFVLWFAGAEILFPH